MEHTYHPKRYIHNTEDSTQSEMHSQDASSRAAIYKRLHTTRQHAHSQSRNRRYLMHPGHILAQIMEKFTIAQLRDYAKSKSITIPASVSTKARIAEYIVAAEASTRTKGDESKMLKKVLSPVPVVMPPDADWKRHLDDNGWAVVPLPGFSDELVPMFYSHLEKCCPDFQRDDTTTWTDKNLPILTHGILKNHFGHTELQWQIRELCYPVFCDLLQEDDLLCSFDGGCFLTPHKQISHWVHVDQPRDYAYTPYQGVVNLLESSGGLILVEDSRLICDDYMRDYPTAGWSWSKADLSYEKFQDLRVIRICAPPGSLTLFNGKMFHANTSPKSGARMCTYVSMQPRELSTEKELAKRIKLYETGRMTGHWCAGPLFEATSKEPFARGRTVNRPDEIEIAELNDLRRKLIGY